MRQRRQATRSVAVTATLLTVGLATAACGGGSTPDAKGPSSSAPPSTSSDSATPTPSASPTATTAPLSQFEDDPAVQAARAWAAAYGTDINNGDPNATALKQTMIPAAAAKAGAYEKSDLALKAYIPGPQPFTPVSVKHGSASANVFACMQFAGWSQDRTTKKPTEDKRVIQGVRFNVRQTGGAWKVVLLNTNGSVTCGDVTVKGVPWT